MSIESIYNARNNNTNSKDFITNMMLKEISTKIDERICYCVDMFTSFTYVVFNIKDLFHQFANIEYFED